MADRKLINPAIVKDIADAIREKGGTTEQIKVADLPNAIMNLPEGGGVGEDTSALLDAIGVESREDTGMANGLAIALTDAPLESSWSGERTTADGMPIKDGVAFVSTLKGKTMNVNQLVPKLNRSTTLNGVAIRLQDGKMAISGTCSASANYIINEMSVIKNHRYALIDGNAKYPLSSYTGDSLQLYSSLINLTIAESFNTPFATGRATATGTATLRHRFEAGNTYNLESYPQFFDLTEMFGSGNEPTTADDFAQRLGYASINDLPYIPYQEPNLQSFAPKSIVSKGRNMIDQDDFFGAVPYWTKDSEGVWSGDIAYLNLKYNGWDKYYPLHCKGGITVSFVCKTDITVTTKTVYWQFFYDDGTKESISKQTSNTYARYTQSSRTDKTLVGFALSYGNNGMFYFKDFQIEMGDATDYTPYIAPSRLDIDLTTIVDADGNQLFPDGELRSAGSVCDEVDYANGVAEAPFDIIDLGKLTWITHMADRHLYSARITNTNHYNGAMLSARYNKGTNAFVDILNLQIRSSQVNPSLLVLRDDAYDTPEALKASLNGQILLYEYKEHLTAQFTPTKSFYPVQNNGAEEAITDNIVPMNAEIRYRIDTESLLTQSTALLAYSNEVTGANNTSLGDAVKTLTDSYK